MIIFGPLLTSFEVRNFFGGRHENRIEPTIKPSNPVKFVKALDTLGHNLIKLLGAYLGA